MQTILFCNRCRGMKVGWNERYVQHCLLCKQWVSKSSKLLILMILLVAISLAFPTPTAFVSSDQDLDHPDRKEWMALGLAVYQPGQFRWKSVGREMAVQIFSNVGLGQGLQSDLLAGALYL